MYRFKKSNFDRPSNCSCIIFQNTQKKSLITDIDIFGRHACGIPMHCQTESLYSHRNWKVSNELTVSSNDHMALHIENGYWDVFEVELRIDSLRISGSLDLFDLPFGSNEFALVMLIGSCREILLGVLLCTLVLRSTILAEQLEWRWADLYSTKFNANRSVP